MISVIAQSSKYNTRLNNKDAQPKPKISNIIILFNYKKLIKAKNAKSYAFMVIYI